MRKVPFWPGGLHIRLHPMGCRNRPFFQIGVVEKKKRIGRPLDENLGSVDVMPNEHNEILVSVDLERLVYWLGKGAAPSYGVSQLLGIAGFFPISPLTYRTAWENRLQKSKEERIQKRTIVDT